MFRRGDFNPKKALMQKSHTFQPDEKLDDWLRGREKWMSYGEK
ncbi:hypothetical protein [Archaeoglobus sp.]|nr:hypothetical protein [Archaeoglobus sp.]